MSGLGGGDGTGAVRVDGWELVERGRRLEVRRGPEIVGTLRRARLGERAELELGPARYALVGGGWPHAGYRCEGDGTVLATATRSAWSYQVRWGGVELAVLPQREASFRPPSRLVRSDGVDLGLVCRVPGSISRTRLLLSEWLPLEARVFVG